MAAESANGHGGLPDAVAASSLAHRFGLEFRDTIDPKDLDPSLVARLPIQYARRCACLPLAERADGAIEVALGDPRSAGDALDHARHREAGVVRAAHTDVHAFSRGAAGRCDAFAHSAREQRRSAEKRGFQELLDRLSRSRNASLV